MVSATALEMEGMKRFFVRSVEISLDYSTYLDFCKWQGFAPVDKKTYARTMEKIFRFYRREVPASRISNEFSYEDHKNLPTFFRKMGQSIT